MKISSITQTAGTAIIDENELIAVITAAVCAAARSEFESKLVVGRIVRTPSRRPAWSQAGLNDVMASRAW